MISSKIIYIFIYILYLLHIKGYICGHSIEGVDEFVPIALFKMVKNILCVWMFYKSFVGTFQKLLYIHIYDH